MYKLKRYYWIFLLFLQTLQLHGQVVFEPTYHTVYPFLSRLAQRGVLDLNDIILPLSKEYIFLKLDEASKKISELTPLERDELSFYLKEYTLWWRKDPKSGFEGVYSSLLTTKIGDRFRYFAHQDQKFTLNLYPILGYQGESRNGYSLMRYWTGFGAYGFLGKSIGFSLDFRATNETGRLWDYERRFTPQTGVIGNLSDFKTFNFNEINAMMTASWQWGNFSFGKNYIPIGYGASGKIILSDKSPSFPQIRLDITPTKWLSFNYTHGWLNSLVVDSLSFYPTSIPNKYQYQYREKYLALHSVTFKPTKKISLMVGESAIYNDNIKIGYLIPITLFSAMSHYMGETNNNSISNSQIFGQISTRNLIKNTHIFLGVFVDELRLRQWGSDSTSSRNHTAYQAGISVTDFPIKNLFLTAEYTRIRPFAYIHFIPAQLYQNNGYNLGHWIGPNADDLYMQMLYRIKRGLEVKVSYSNIRKGTEGSGLQQANDNKYLYPFLWGDEIDYKIFQAQVQYEWFHDFFLRLGFQHQDANNLKTNEVKNQDQAYLGVSIGF